VHVFWANLEFAPCFLFGSWSDPRSVALNVFLLTWLFTFGGVVGSFLNVVAFRLPHGLSLVRPPSRCPSCGHAIRPVHNVPIVGWFLLHGRCFDCGTAIPARYPFVEFVSACLFLAPAFVGLAADGGNMPFRRDEGWLPWTTVQGREVYAAARYMFQAASAAWLLALALIQTNGHRAFGRRSMLLGAAAIFLGSMVPQLRPVAWVVGLPPLGLSQPLWGLADGLCGLVCGALAGAVQFPRHWQVEAASKPPDPLYFDSEMAAANDTSTVPVVEPTVGSIAVESDSSTVPGRSHAVTSSDDPELQPQAQPIDQPLPQPERDPQPVSPPEVRLTLYGHCLADRIGIPAVLGAFLGWQAVLCVSALAVALELCTRLACKWSSLPLRTAPAVFLMLSHAVWLTGWKWLWGLVDWAPPPIALATTASLFAACSALSWAASAVLPAAPDRT
jgi:prepilin signal peptidase PulO-like enzyme (type II secretory pathway)